MRRAHLWTMAIVLGLVSGHIVLNRGQLVAAVQFVTAIDVGFRVPGIYGLPGSNASVPLVGSIA